MKLNRKTIGWVVVLLIAVCLWTAMITIAPFILYGAEDSFYQRGDDLFDVDLHFPLIKPYYADAYPEGFPSNNEFGKYVWEISPELGSKSKIGGYFRICCNIRIAVEDDIIFIHAPDQTQLKLDSNQVRYYWFVLNPKESVELGFEDQARFEEYLIMNNIGELKWQDPDYLHEKFNMTGCLDWYPDCKKVPPIFRFPPSLFETYDQ